MNIFDYLTINKNLIRLHTYICTTSQVVLLQLITRPRLQSNMAWEQRQFKDRGKPLGVDTISLELVIWFCKINRKIF